MIHEYIIDSNIFISSHRVYYPFDLMPTYWEYLLKLSEENICILVDEVHKEIMKNDDELSRWFEANKESFDIKSSKDDRIVNAYSSIITNVMSSSTYSQQAKSVFASCTDSWIIAHALANKYTIVTNELRQVGAKNRVMIPNVCEEFGIRYIKMTEFLRETGFRV